MEYDTIIYLITCYFWNLVCPNNIMRTAFFFPFFFEEMCRGT